ncbi:MAG: TM0106 family RecB-like putative nuclease [Candidatus Dormiibacterota bacterium]
MKITDGRVRFSASDLSNFLACRHVTRLDTRAANGRLKPAREYDAGFDELIERGEKHERRVLAGFRTDGHEVLEIPKVFGQEAEGAQATRDAIRRGVAVIYQGALGRGAANGAPALLGYPDFLVRADILPRKLGVPVANPATYEVVDAKLARSAKARAVLQTAFYSALLADEQGVAPEFMHLALGGGTFSSFRLADYAAYERQIRRALEIFVAEDTGELPPSSPYPEPVEHCAICRWSTDCDSRRRRDDDLSLVAGMPTNQRIALKAVDVSTRRRFAGLTELPTIGRGNVASLAMAQLQARLQVRSEDMERIEYELLDPERDADGALVPNRGLLALPEPCVGDLFFDIEGARYYTEDDREFGLQYLFGIVDTADMDASGTPRYTEIWAYDRSDEKLAFEELIDFITDRRKVNPGLHVYHYNHYEPTSIEQLTSLHETRQEAVGRLMGRFATHEDAVDDLFRRGVFVDLYRVVRQGLRAGVESYSIKRLEPLVGYGRVVDLRDATTHLIAFEQALDEGTAKDAATDSRVVAGYNEDDCRSTLALRDWLEARRPELATKLGCSVPRPVVQAEPESTEDPEIVELRAKLQDGLPEDEATRTQEQRALALLADLLDYFRRDNKPAWWKYFHVRNDLNDAERLYEREAISGLAFIGTAGQENKSTLFEYSFPPQEHGSPDTVEDPATGNKWALHAIDDARGVLTLKRGPSRLDDPHPSAVINGGPQYSKKIHTAQLKELARQLLRAPDAGWPLSPAVDLLLRRSPRVGGEEAAPLMKPGETATDAARRLVMALATSVLPIQGPPGTGKTYTGAHQILDLVQARRRVGVTANSHAVICHLLDELAKAAEERHQTVRIGQRADRDSASLSQVAADAELVFANNEQVRAALADGVVDVVGGTTWVWAAPTMTECVDVLFVDEAGQMCLADALAVASAAKNVVFLGDPMQLAQPSQGSHPPGSDVSALEHVLGGASTMPPESGLFIAQTRRMHPAICEFTSDTFYEGRLTGIPGLEHQAIIGATEWSGSGIRIAEVVHHGNSNASPEEAARVAALVTALLTMQWRNQERKERPMTMDDVLIVTPYNAQIREIEQALIRAAVSGVKVGTVDKFQGRQAPAVIYSMASSSVDDAPRGLEFLFDLHRLNVATSRAQALAIIVASPDLMRVFCGTPRQMVLANALCRAWEAG